MTIPVGFGQCTHIFAGSSLDTGAAVVFGFEHDSSTVPETAAAALHDAWGDEIMPQLVNVVQLTQTIVKFGPDDVGPSAEFNAVVTGGDASPGAPANTAYLVTKTTALGGRRGRGRMYLPGVDETEVGGDGVVTPAKLTGLDTAIQAWFARVIALPWLGSLQLLHEPSAPGTENPSPEPPPTAIITLTVQQKVATQRRRLRRT